MNILYISKSTIPSRSANSIHVMKMCQAFADNGHEVVLIAPDLKNKYERNINDVYKYYGVKNNFTIKKLFHPNFKSGALFYIIAIFFYVLSTKKFDLVYGRFLHGIYVSSLLNNQVIYETHLPVSEKNNHRLIIFKKLIKSKSLKKMVVISQALKNIYLKKGYLKDSQIQVAHDGADAVENFDNKIQLLGHKDNLKVGYVGHLYKGRGIETIISCAKKLNDMTFHFVGGLKEDIEYWKSYSKNLNLDNVYFYGFVSPNETVKYRNAFDILLAPYEKKVSIFGSHETDTSKFMSPLKIFEYMSHKKPIIASDLPVIREVLNDRNSLLVNPDDINLWINSIVKLKDPKNRELIANQALTDFYNYSWKNRAHLVVKI
tara:strand:+ start:31285 stop:32406 length:1122 start_codon:yes stop_codon:yes gene_type:complete